jgi:hypothetical protein
MTLPSKFAREFELPVGVMPLGPQLDKRKFSGGGAIPPWQRLAQMRARDAASGRDSMHPPGLERSLRLTSRVSFKLPTAWRSSAAAESDLAVDRL